MKKYTTEELVAIIAKHKKWLNNEDGGERADLSYSDLSYSNLSGSNLSGSNLSGSNLSGSNLSGSDLSYSNLSGSNLSGSDLSYSNLSESDLRGSDLSYSNLSESDLRGSNLSESDLRGSDLSYSNLRNSNLRNSNLSGSDLSGSNLSDTKNIDDVLYNEGTSFYAIQCPEDGAFVAWKKCVNGIIVKLMIPEDAKRSSATTRKCRASKAIVLEVIGAETAVSQHDSSFVYEVGKEMIPHEWCDDRWKECTGGIHFFITRKEAEKY